MWICRSLSLSLHVSSLTPASEQMFLLFQLFSLFSTSHHHNHFIMFPNKKEALGLDCGSTDCSLIKQWWTGWCRVLRPSARLAVSLCLSAETCLGRTAVSLVWGGFHLGWFPAVFVCVCSLSSTCRPVQQWNTLSLVVCFDWRDGWSHGRTCWGCWCLFLNVLWYWQAANAFRH